MINSLHAKLENINQRLAEILEDAGRALRGETSFGVFEVRKMTALVEEMNPIMERAAELRRTQPETVGQFDLYTTQLRELQKTVEQLRVALVLQKASLEGSSAQVTAASQWCAAFRQTR